MDERKLTEEFQKYRRLGQQNKNIDVAGLMTQALEHHETNLISSRQKHWAFIVSLVLPPLGLFFAIRFYLSGKDDGRQTALMCAILTIVSIFFGWFTLKIFLSGSGINLEQLQQINPEEIKQLYQ